MARPDENPETPAGDSGPRSAPGEESEVARTAIAPPRTATETHAATRAQHEPDAGADDEAGGLSDTDLFQLEQSTKTDGMNGFVSAPVNRDMITPEERQRRREGDVDLIKALRAARYKGRLFDLFCAEYAEYGCRIMITLMRSGEIISRCARMPPRRPRPLPISETPRWTDDDIRELADETVTLALGVFVTRALREGRWDPNGPASLRTYFVNCCILQYPNVFSRWRGQRKNWEDNALLDRGECVSTSAETVTAAGASTEWSDPTATIALDTVIREELLGSLKPRERIIMELRARGHSQVQIAEFLHLPVTTVRGVVDRVRNRAKGDADRWRAE
ncbi:hypothetical protein OHR68_20975 [Spirillospora sp. NBC_00431]